MTYEIKWTLSRLLADDTTFAVTGWGEEDISNALEVIDLPVTKDNVNALLAIAGRNRDALVEAMCDAGWQFLYNLRDSHTKQQWRVEYIKKDGSSDSVLLAVPNTADPDQLETLIGLINDVWEERKIESIVSLKKMDIVIA